ncbi:nitrogen fixation protein NifB [Anaerospora hongkongensis]|uniref:FeMo cofactor biosynthesis protein NifB n=1 Tax=Anaerospora hongkongensis TaxID=244830 RepID=A0A4R1Q291_9FIRM|nr:nitrogenase cofactor biosynthesis protein NifB [Anaerospora hongkongensis]TCL37768.1 nitrogen fixation protein NifB [Anaerospora hongkongensis]
MGMPDDIAEKTSKHPCYSAEAHTKYARMHLPVAPACNIQCNYCNRKFDCVHESRPGVTSEILTPAEALLKFSWVKEQIEQLSVVGIAGPGDALANWPETKKAIELIKAIDPKMTFCLSTNGLMLPEYGQEIIDLGVNHVTVTCNAIDPEIGAKLYQYARYKGERLTGVTAAQVLLKNQLAGIEFLANHGVLVKVNIVMVTGVNDQHIPEVVKKVKELGAFITNIMPLIPAPGSNFENFPQTSMKDINEMRNLCQLDMQQMRHCKQCRADAIGLLGEDRSQEFRLSSIVQQQPASEEVIAKPIKIAVASKYGKLVDLHFGHATEFRIYQGENNTFKLLETRQVDKYCAGMQECDTEEERREVIVESLKDCAAVLTMRIGHSAKERLRRKGIQSIEFCDSVENGLRYTAEELKMKEVM